MLRDSPTERGRIAAGDRPHGAGEAAPTPALPLLVPERGRIAADDRPHGAGEAAPTPALPLLVPERGRIAAGDRPHGAGEAAPTPALPLLVPERGRIAAGDRPFDGRRTLKLPHQHLGWHSRGYLPHFDHPGLTQSITFRLADSLPATQSAAWREIAALASTEARREEAERWLDRGLGSCALREPAAAALAQDALLFFDAQRYRLVAWVIMPNHVHALIETVAGWPLGKLIKSWKSHSARAINALLERQGSFWQPDYFDRYIRDDSHFRREIAYIEENPVEAGLVSRPSDWPWSSASAANRRRESPNL